MLCLFPFTVILSQAHGDEEVSQQVQLLLASPWQGWTGWSRDQGRETLPAGPAPGTVLQLRFRRGSRGQVQTISQTQYSDLQLLEAQEKGAANLDCFHGFRSSIVSVVLVRQSVMSVWLHVRVVPAQQTPSVSPPHRDVPREHQGRAGSRGNQGESGTAKITSLVLFIYLFIYLYV